MPASTITLSQYECSPPLEVGSGSELEVRGYYANSFIGADGVTLVEGNRWSGQQGFYYSITPTLSAGNVLTVPAHDIEPTTESNPTSVYTEDLWVDGAFYSRLLPNTNSGTGWQIPTVYGDPIAFDEIATYNRANTLLYPPITYFTADQTIQEIERIAGDLNYAGVDILGRTELDWPPAIASVPIAVGVNSRRVTEMYNVKAYGASGNGVFDNLTILDTLVNTTLQVTGAGGDVYFPAGTYLISSDMQFPQNVRLNFDPRAMLKPATGAQVTISGAINAAPYKIFTNATAGLGTILFTANGVLTEIYTEWWGAGNTLSGVSATTNAAAFQAASDALCTNNASGFASGLIRFGPGIYDFNATWYIGVNDAAGIFTGISLRGTNGLVGTKLNWTGSTSGTAIEFGRARRPRIDDIFLDNGVANGTTIGIIFSGAGSSMQTSGPVLTSVGVRGFHYGVQEGGIPGNLGASQAAEFTTFINCFLTENDYGYIGASSGNTVGIIFENIYCTLNTVFGILTGAGTSTTHINSGLFTGNGTAGNLSTGDIGVSLDWNRTVAIEKCRFEVGNGTTDTHIGGIVNVGNIGATSIRNCVVQSNGAVPTVPIVRGISYLTLESNTIGVDAEDGWIVSNADNLGSGDWRFIQNQIQNMNTRTVPGGGNNTVALGLQFDPSFTGASGLKITAEGNYYANLGAVTKHDNVNAIIGLTIASSEKVYASRRTNAFGEVSSDVYLWTNQDTTPSVKWASFFQTQNSGATLYSNFLNPVEGQTILVEVADANTSFANNSTIQTRTAGTVVGVDGLTYSFTYRGTKWRMNY